MSIYESEINSYNVSFDDHTLDGLYKPFVKVEKQKEKKNSVIAKPKVVKEVQPKVEDKKPEESVASEKVEEPKEPEVQEKPKRRGRPPKKVVEESNE